MEDKQVGILGLGNIGRQVAKRLQGFGCKVHYFSRHTLPEEQEFELNVRHVSLHELFASSDIVTVHVPLTPETAGMVGRSELAMMKPSAILINTSRGQVIDEAALIVALQENRIAGVGLDVFEPQPLEPSNPLLKMDNVIATPHSASAALERWPRTALFAWRNVQRVWDGQPPLALITV
jgi:phosphoglycerate dehydrogenase-like enzyme